MSVRPWYLNGSKRRPHELAASGKSSSVTVLFFVVMFIDSKPNSVSCWYNQYITHWSVSKIICPLVCIYLHKLAKRDLSCRSSWWKLGYIRAGKQWDIHLCIQNNIDSLTKKLLWTCLYQFRAVWLLSELGMKVLLHGEVSEVVWQKACENFSCLCGLPA